MEGYARHAAGRGRTEAAEKTKAVPEEAQSRGQART